MVDRLIQNTFFVVACCSCYETVAVLVLLLPRPLLMLCSMLIPVIVVYGHDHVDDVPTMVWCSSTIFLPLFFVGVSRQLVAVVLFRC
jgi:hypothetical protein